MNTKSCKFMRNMCRTCMTQFSEIPINKKQCIYEVPTGFNKGSSIMELLQQLQPEIKIDCNGALPTLMCSDCIQKLLISYEFIETYRNSESKFRAMLKVSKHLNTLENSLPVAEDNDNGITKNEYEIQVINIEGVKKNLEDTNVYSDYKNEILDENDFNDSEWTPSECCSQNESVKSTAIQKERRTIPKKIMVDVKELNQLPEGNEDGEVPCHECDAVLDNVKLWQKHMRQHRLGNIPKTKYTMRSNKLRRNLINKKFECEDCGKGFGTTTTYKNHIRIHTGEQPYLCIECGKRFRGLGSMKIHMLRHNTEKTFQCPHCPKKFVCPSGLNRHEKTHMTERPFVCDTCGSTFRSAYQLKIHDRCHKGIKNYKCEYCDKRFISMEKQKRHMRTHTGEKPYRCKYCEKAFAQSNDYIKHLRKHLGNNVYQCDLCPLRFPLVRDLRVHFVSHKDEDEETRTSNLEARKEEQRNLDIRLGVMP